MNKTYRKRINASKLCILLTIAIILPSSLLLLLIANFFKWIQAEQNNQCHTEENLTLTDNIPLYKKGMSRNNESTCFDFYAFSGQQLILRSNTRTTLLTPNNNNQTLQGQNKIALQETGNYSIEIAPSQKNTSYDIELKVEPQTLGNNPELQITESKPYIPQDNTVLSQLSYNVTTPPPFEQNQKLQKIVDGITSFVQLKGLPTERLSISLVDLNSSNCCTYASYLDRQPRFPASVVKLFWMVDLYGQYQAGVIPEETIADKELSKMIQDSSNESASRVLDKITKTESGKDLTAKKLNNWIAKRYSVNQFFEIAGYQPINVSQKTFPIPYLKFDEPTGRELQMRGDASKPLRNYITSYSVARLLFEIHTNQSISKAYSRKMESLMKRDLNPEAWKQKPYNSISGFLGESLPADTYFASKMGWTFSNRNDAAIIASPDGKARYILVIFGDEPSFYQDKKLFPQISRMVYDQMIAIKNSQ